MACLGDITMGTLKHEMEEDAEKNDAAIKVLIAAKYYEECICGQIKATGAVDW